MKKRNKVILLFIIFHYLSGPLFAGYFESGQKYYIYKKYDKAREMFTKAAEASDRGDAYYFMVKFLTI